MPTTGANIVGPSSAFDQSDWLKTSPSFLNGKKNLYFSWTSKSDVSDTNNSVCAVGQPTVSAAMFARHNTGNSAAPAAWLIGYTFSDRSVQYKSPVNSGANNKQQRIAFQIRSGAEPQMWIDGVLQTPNAITQDPTGAGYPTGGLVVQTADELLIGRAVHGLWDGLIDEFRVIEQTVDTNYALTEFRNLNNIDDMVVFGDVETPSSALSPRGELILAETTPGTKVRIKVDTLVVNPNPSSVVLSSVSTPTSGTAVKIDDANVDFTPTSAVGTSRFLVTFTSSGKSVQVPVVVNVSGTVIVEPPVEPPVSTGYDYWSSPNYGTKTKVDVGTATELRNRIADINTATQYINMTFTCNEDITVSRGGTATHPLIISAAAPSGPTNFSGRAGFTKTVKLTGNYIWLDRLKFTRTSDTCVRVQGGAWKFITRCQLSAGEAIYVGPGYSNQEVWIGFNQFLDNGTDGYSHVHFEIVKGQNATNPKKGRVYYNVISYTGGATGESACIMSGPGADADGALISIDDTWVHYNYIRNNRGRKIYCKHGMDVRYNDIGGSGAHSIAFRGASIGECMCEYNRTTGKVLVQGPGHTLRGNIIGGDIEVSCDQQNKSAPKPILGANYSNFYGNSGKLLLGIKMTPEGTIKDPLHDIIVQDHTGTIAGESGSAISFNSAGHPVSNGNYYTAASITKKPNSTYNYEAVPTLSETICGPGSTRGKVWGT